MKKRFIISILLFCVSASSHAITYYVSNAGSNSNNGLSLGTAFQTLQYAADHVVAGDSVIVQPGTYVGFYQTTSGTQSKPIVFSAMNGALVNAKNFKTNDGINLEGANYITVEGFKVYGVPRAGIRAVIDTGVIIRNNRIDSCGVWGILTGFSERILIERNECSRSGNEHGIYFGNSADYPVIRNNICWGNRACGIHMNSDVFSQPDEGVADGIISNALVEGNIIYDNGVGGGSGINCDGVQNSRIQNNMLYNNRSSGISLYQIDGAQGAKNNVVVNNTILQPANGRWALNISDGSTGNIVFNNIFYSAHSFRGSISIDAASLTGFKSNYNVLVGRMSNDGSDTNMDLAEWQQATHTDSNSILSTPALLFVNSGGNDYHLSATSPARDMEAISYALSNAPITDMENAVRPQGSRHDAGAYEYEVVVTGVEQQTEMGVSVYPNPASNHLLIDAGNLQPEKIVIYNASGSRVDEITFNWQVDVSSLKAGVYYIEVRSATLAIRKAFVKL